MENVILKTASVDRLAKNTWRLMLKGGVPELRPGQFVNIDLPGFYLRRPFSVSDFTRDTLTIVFKTVGAGTDRMTRLRPGDELDVLMPLGNGFDASKAGDRPLIVGGGAGVAPMAALARELACRADVTVILGFNSADEVFYKDVFEALGARVIITTADGSEGLRGFVTEGMKGLAPSFIYACGPEPMLKAVYGASDIGGEYSFEARMGCGYGACVGCTRRMKSGNKRVCKDGPVFAKEEIIW